ncbi:hypothetical protein Leryth_026687 [Lithospermum erythrorhizon]|nr:hypothetical protein Leryth_026687 [Lithospermum erythrorhizon]
MAAKFIRAPSPSYEEIEPFCTWQREEARETLIVHLPDFKKDQLRVQINNYGILKISGERQINATKKCKFYKEVPVPKNCINDEIRVKFINGCLYISMPKQASSAVHNTKKGEVTNPNQTQTSAPNEGGNAEQDLESDQAKKPVKNLKGYYKKVAINLAAIFVMLGALSVFFIYMFRATIIND